MSNQIINNNENNNTSIEIREEEGGHGPTLSTSSLLTISKCVNLITEQEADNPPKENIENPTKSNFQPHNPKNPIQNPYISETLRTKMSQLIIETSPNQTPLNTYIKHAPIANIKSERFLTEPSSSYHKTLLGRISRLDQAQSPVTQSSNYPKLKISSGSKLTKKILIGTNNPSLNHVIHLSNEMQNKQKKMLFGLYKNKMEFEDDLDDFRSQLEKKNRSLFTNDIHLKYDSQVYKNLNKSSYYTKASVNNDTSIKRKATAFKMRFHTAKPSIDYQPTFLQS